MSYWCIRPDGKSSRVKITDEFGWGSHTACGETCNAGLRANAGGNDPSYALAETICQRDRVRGWTDGPAVDSQWIGAVLSDFQNYPNKPTLSSTLSYPFGEWGTDQLALVSKSLIGRQGGILVEFSQAWKLPFMESGVQYHFCFLGAYDDTRTDGTHFLLLNPDRVPRPSSPYGGDWVTIFQLAAAGICGLLKVVV